MVYYIQQKGHSNVLCGYPRLILPPPQKQSTIDIAHKEVGYMLVVKTMRKLQEAFAWPYVKKDITNFIEQYPVCIEHAKVVPRATMGEMPIALPQCKL